MRSGLLTLWDGDVSLFCSPLHELPDYNWIRRRSYWLRY